MLSAEKSMQFQWKLSYLYIPSKHHHLNWSGYHRNSGEKSTTNTEKKKNGEEKNTELMYKEKSLADISSKFGMHEM